MMPCFRRAKPTGASRYARPTTSSLSVARDSAIGYTLSAEARAKISAANTGRKPWLGKKHSAETRAKIGAAHMGKKLPPVSEAVREKHRQRMLGKPGPRHSAEVRARIGAAAKGNTRCLGRVLSDETKKKIADARRGRHLPASPGSLEALARAADARRGKPLPEETRAKLSAALKGHAPPNTGKPPSEETRAKIAASLRGRKQPPRSPEYRAKAAERARGNTNWLGKRHTPEQLAKMSAAQKAYNERKHAAQGGEQGVIQPPLLPDSPE